MSYYKNHGTFRVRDRVFQNGTHVMAILNATPDSFFSESRLADRAVEAVERFEREGAEIIDIGGQSTRPGAKEVSAIEEMSRVLPVLQAVRPHTDLPISIDTFYPEVAQACIDFGADMINDVSCLSYDGMAEVIGNSGVSLCIMHDRRKSTIPDLFFDKQMGLSNAIRKLLDCGVDKEKILLDGGIGFNKSKDEDWQLLNGYDMLMSDFDGYGFLLGTSRKSMLGGEVETRLSATLDTTITAVKKGILFVRVHDVKENKAVIDACRRD